MNMKRIYMIAAVVTADTDPILDLLSASERFMVLDIVQNRRAVKPLPWGV